MKLDDQIKYCRHQMGTAHPDTDTFKAIKESLEFLLSLVPGYQKDGGLYQDCINAYDEFLKKTIGVGVRMNGIQGKAMKAIIKYLRTQSRDKNDEGVLASWTYILDHWDRQNEFIGKQKDLTSINKNLIEILDNLKNGNSKATKTRNQQDKQQLRDAIKNRG